jgi:YD repeat-containing protein
MRRQAVAAIAAVMPPPAGTGGGRAAGSPYRMNPANGRVRTAISPPSAGKFDIMPSFYYNSAALGATEYGFGWTGSFRRQVTEIDPSTADVTLDNGNVLRYTNKDAGGQYDAPGKTANGLKKNANNTWTENRPDGFLYNYDTSGKLATLANYRGKVWTLTRDAGGKVTSIQNPVQLHDDTRL